MGDIHGQFFDLHPLLECVGGFDNAMNWVFNGDLVDRGRFSSEVTLVVLANKVNDPHRFTVLRGNHESASQMTKQGTNKEFIKKYREETFQLVVDCFHALPVAAVVASGGKRIFCCHGGIGPRVGRVDQLNGDIGDRFVEPTSNKVVRDLTWSDPSDDMVVEEKPSAREWDLKRLKAVGASWSRAAPSGQLTADMFRPNPSRGSSIASYTLEATHTFCAANDILTIIRGHEQKDGFQFSLAGPAYDFPCVITSFSAPNYTDRSKNKGSVVTLRDGVLRIHEFGWRLHPSYDSNNEKDLLREDFHQFVQHTHPKALMELTEDQLDEAFMALFPVRRPPKDKRDLWRMLRDNIEQIPDLTRSSTDDLHTRAFSLVDWFGKVDHLKRGLKAEAENELDTFSTDEDEEDRPYRREAEPSKKKSKKRRGSGGGGGGGGGQDRPSSPELARFRAAFDLFDADGSGEISVSELRLVLKSLGKSATDQELARLIKEHDKDHSGKMEFDEFVDFVRSELSDLSRTERAIKMAWDAFDADASGFVSAAELKRVMCLLGQRVTDAEILIMLDRADTEGDSQLSFDEFRAGVIGQLDEHQDDGGDKDDEENGDGDRKDHHHSHHHHSHHHHSHHSHHKDKKHRKNDE